MLTSHSFSRIKPFRSALLQGYGQCEKDNDSRGAARVRHVPGGRPPQAWRETCNVSIHVSMSQCINKHGTFEDEG